MRRAAPFLCAGVLAVGALFLRSCQAEDYIVLQTHKDASLGDYAVIVEKGDAKSVIVGGKMHAWDGEKVFLAHLPIRSPQSECFRTLAPGDYPIVYLVRWPESDIVSIFRVSDGVRLFPE